MATPLSFEQRILAFWSKVDKDGPVPPLHPEMSNCWIWLGARNHKNYGTFSMPMDGRQRFLKAHRFAHFLCNGVWPPLVIDHLCHVTLCVRPEHLRAVSQKENCNNKAKQICVRGHPLTEENFYYYGGGRRRCKGCIEFWKAEMKARKEKVRS